MAARICSPCLVNWPNMGKFTECPICGEDTEYDYKRAPEYNEAEALAYAKDMKARLAERKITDASPAHLNRVERYLALGFSEVDAQVMALATRVHVDSTGRKLVRAVNHLDVARALASGCSHALAVEIFS
jgi:hypothetical protein